MTPVNIDVCLGSVVIWFFIFGVSIRLGSSFVYIFPDLPVHMLKVSQGQMTSLSLKSILFDWQVF